ncbi:ERI1 exoribonuclease 3-like [Penaeus japonicus]|uniref:ERI1 exoribonuclease 3-like n=1 Tax=Penaeus japonicus TaxID=27405 RepID=UPI001C715A31|nr:ERI1 exoribonuclease 3-like [Penaeus japonicus]XP_042855809.1 ERI1 exoribonuclease 3-like [Penaeus japonicus]
MVPGYTILRYPWNTVHWLKAEKYICCHSLSTRQLTAPSKVPPRLFNSHLRRKPLKMTNRIPQDYDYFLVLDFEATCDQDKLIQPQEIIEFPVLKVDARTFRIESTFHEFVKPVHNPLLTDFCIKLTTISQEEVDDGKDFRTVIHLFDKWVREDVGLDKKFLFVTCGDWDLKTMLPRQCKTENVQVPNYCKRWHNIKQSYFSITNQYIKGMMPMLAGLNLKHMGTLHRGLDDCHNIANILRELANKGCKFQSTNSIE